MSTIVRPPRKTRGALPGTAALWAGALLPVRNMLVLSALVAAATSFGLLTDDAYRARAGSLTAPVVSVGTLTWLTSCYAHQAIGVPFNAMFLAYVAVAGMAAFAMIDGLVRIDVVAAAPASRETRTGPVSGS